MISQTLSRANYIHKICLNFMFVTKTIRYQTVKRHIINWFRVIYPDPPGLH